MNTFTTAKFACPNTPRNVDIDENSTSITAPLSVYCAQFKQIPLVDYTFGANERTLKSGLRNACLTIGAGSEETPAHAELQKASSHEPHTQHLPKRSRLWQHLQLQTSQMLHPIMAKFLSAIAFAAPPSSLR